MKKLLCLLMATILVIGLFAGCGEEKITNSLYDPTIKVGDTGGLKMPLTNDAMTIEWQVIGTETNLNDSWFIKKLEGITGVDINLNIMAAASRDQKVQTLIASGKYPDIFGSLGSAEIATDLAMQGAFAAVEDYVDVLPNFKKTFVDNKENSWIFDAYAAPDGKLYFFRGYDWQRDINHAVMYRKDVFDKHGIKMWENDEEFYAALKALKTAYPDSLPYTSKYGDQIFAKWAPGWGIKAHEPYFDEAEKVWKYSDTDAKFKDMLDFMKKLYNEGLMDPEFLTNTQASWTQKMTNGKSFVTFDWIDRMTMFKEQTLETIPEYDLRFANPIGPNGTYAEVSQITGGSCVKKMDEKREKVAFQLLDFMLSPAGKELTSMGLEGETYTLGDDGMAIMIGFEDEPGVSGTKLTEKWGLRIEGMWRGFDRRCSYFNFAPQLKEAQDFMQDKKNIDPLDPVLAFESEEKTVINEWTANLQKAGKEFAVKYILGNESWDKWVEKAKSLGSEKIVEVYNKAYNRNYK